MNRKFTDARDLMPCVPVFSQSGSPQRLACSSPPPTGHLNTEESCYVSHPSAKQANLLAFFTLSLSYRVPSREVVNTNFLGIEPTNIDCEADALTTAPMCRCNHKCFFRISSTSGSVIVPWGPRV